MTARRESLDTKLRRWHCLGQRDLFADEQEEFPPEQWMEQDRVRTGTSNE